MSQTVSLSLFLNQMKGMGMFEAGAMKQRKVAKDLLLIPAVIMISSTLQIPP